MNNLHKHNESYIKNNHLNLNEDFERIILFSIYQKLSQKLFI